MVVAGVARIACWDDVGVQHGHLYEKPSRAEVLMRNSKDTTSIASSRCMKSNGYITVKE